MQTREAQFANESSRIDAEISVYKENIDQMKRKIEIYKNIHGAGEKFVKDFYRLLPLLDQEWKAKKIVIHFSMWACHPCAGAMLIFSVSFQF